MSTKDFFESIDNIVQENLISNKDINEVKKDGWERFKDLGLPPNDHTRELWKYSNFSNLQNIKYSNAEYSNFDLEGNLNNLVDNTPNNIFIVNGFFDSNKSNFTEDIIVESSSTLDKLDYLKSSLGTIAKNEENELIALNSSIMLDPVFISIKNQKKENSINIFIITTHQKKEFSSSPRLFIEASKIYKNLNKKTKSIISIFSGRMADVGKDPVPIIEKAVQMTNRKNKVEILWASTREPYNYTQAKQIGCQIITVPPKIIEKVSSFGKSFDQLTKDTVKAFLQDSKKSRFKI